jgi:hypothetical protein
MAIIYNNNYNLCCVESLPDDVRDESVVPEFIVPEFIVPEESVVPEFIVLEESVVPEFIVPEELVVPEFDVPELGEVVPVLVEPEFLLPLHAAKQRANAAAVIKHFTFFIIKGFYFIDIKLCRKMQPR